MQFRDKIRREAEDRGIPYAVHFTQLSNLPGIIENGFLSRLELLGNRSDGLVSATHRLDDEITAVSVSVSAMNWSMFLSKRNANGRAAWVVLLLDRSIFWTHPCRFLSLNAARKAMKEHRGRLDGHWAFLQMFSNDARPSRYEGGDYRESMGIPPYLTTRPEAEVQVFSPISPEAILGAWVERPEHGLAVEAELARIADGRPRAVAVRSFAPRFSNDYAQWG